MILANAHYCINGLEDWMVVTRPREMDVEVTKVVADSRPQWVFACL